MPAACAIASRISTPGMIGRCGKWPGKYGSLAETFFTATMRLKGSNSFTRSSIIIGKRWGRCASTSLMSISATFFLLCLQLAHPVQERGEVPHHGRVAQPGAVLLRGIQAGVGPGLEQRMRDHGGAGNRHVVRDLYVSDNLRRAADGAVGAD